MTDQGFSVEEQDSNELLVEEGGKLDKEIKRLQKKLEIIKDKFRHLVKAEVGTENFAGTTFTCQIITTNKYAEIEPLDALAALERFHKQEEFVDIVKVVITTLRDKVGKDEVDKLLGKPLGLDTPKVAFKKINKK